METYVSVTETDIHNCAKYFPEIFTEINKLAEEPKKILMTAMARLVKSKICPFCKVHGHSLFECSLKKSMDKCARDLGLNNEWGKVKYAAYFQNQLLTNKTVADGYSKSKKAQHF